MIDTLAKVIIINDSLEDIIDGEELNINNMTGVLSDMEEELKMIESEMMAKARQHAMNVPISTRAEKFKRR